MSNTGVDIEPTSREWRLKERAKIIAFCQDNAYMYEETADSIEIIVPLFKPIAVKLLTPKDKPHE